MALQARERHAPTFVKPGCETEGCERAATVFWQVNDPTHWLPLCEAHALEIAAEVTWSPTIVALIT